MPVIPPLQPNQPVPTFNGPLVLGSIRGLRKFRMTQDGELTGLFFRQAWGPGENIAYHHPPAPTWGYPYFGYYSGEAKSLPAVKPPDDPKYHRGKEFSDCKCGFYAFYHSGTEGDTRYIHEVTGIIEGYGEVVIGTRGFRSQKAKIVAACITIKGMDAERVELFPNMYPGVAIFGTVEEMNSEYPTKLDE